jgi:hypothetical protein
VTDEIKCKKTRPTPSADVISHAILPLAIGPGVVLNKGALVLLLDDDDDDEEEEEEEGVEETVAPFAAMFVAGDSNWDGELEKGTAGGPPTGDGNPTGVGIMGGTADDELEVEVAEEEEEEEEDAAATAAAKAAALEEVETILSSRREIVDLQRFTRMLSLPCVFELTSSSSHTCSRGMQPATKSTHAIDRSCNWNDCAHPNKLTTLCNPTPQ